jgi:hypothetical protein
MLFRLLQNASEDYLISLKQLVESAPAAFIRWYWVVLNPISAGVLKEVLAGINGFVNCLRIQATLWLRRFIVLCGAYAGEHEVT